MFGFNKNNKASKRWSLDDYELIDTTINKSYPFNKLFAAFNEQEELMTIWFNNQFLATLSCAKRVFDSILTRGVRECSDFIFPLKNTDFSNGKTSIVFSGGHLLINNKPKELSQLVLTENESNELLISDTREQLALISRDMKKEFIEAYQYALDNLTKKMTGKALAIFEAEVNKEQADLRWAQQQKEEALKYAEAEKADFKHIILTTESVSPFTVKKRLGIVSAEYAHRTKMLQHFLAELSSIGQQRASSTQKALKQAKETVLLELRREAYLLGADAVVAVDLDYSEISGAGDPLLFLVANGTAITIEKDKHQ
jgi:uncharacterized protein YbjQ (UPF0145 family)